MNKQRLELFVDLTETLNYMQTAERLYTSQGNVSKQIMALEKELGCQLFIRGHRKISLTEIGEKVLEHAKILLAGYKALEDEVNSYQQTQAQTFTLHGLPTMSAYKITQMIGKFHQNYPQFTLNIEEEEGNTLVHSLEQKSCHVIFNRYFEDDLPKDNYLTVEEDELIVVLPQNHPLGTQDSVSLEDLREEDFLQLGNSSQIFAQVLAACQRAGFEPNITYQGKRINYILEFIAQGMGISLLMAKSIQHYHLENVVIRPLKEKISCQLCLVTTQENRTPAVETFWDFVAEELKAEK